MGDGDQRDKSDEKTRGDQAGEDEESAAKEGNKDHLKEDQKSGY